MTIQVRLTLLIVTIFILGVVSVVYRTASQARVELNREVAAATDLTLTLLNLSDAESPVSGLRTAAAV